MRIFPIDTVENKRRALRAVNAIMGPDGEEVLIRKRVTSGSQEQVIWFNMLCKMIADETGDDVESEKNRIKIDSFGWQDGELDGVRFQFVPRSTLHGMKGLSQLIDGAYKRGADLGLVLPDPDPNWKRTKRPDPVEE